MSRLLSAGVVALAGLAACTNLQSTYQNEPLVAQVRPGMSREQVHQLGGAPLASVPRKIAAGTCDDYQLGRSGAATTYYVAYDASGKVQSTGFTNCNGFEHAEYDRANPDHGGY
ncbi:osmotically-inducible lipoprotein OsmE [Pseudomonas sp. UL073]|uniref:Osmotically-inducible lipoprotein OsmE n=1 Tax=Zestomonas insulae TaxID=2809017 RepID=A0ABS2IGS5_9GAMM|nr:osmotically-inducible lipoprotein OsmE [Pseudomonas insulae]MBM7062260.1 osmotically-inducible lipoprotein OsmE [Pseudomonas insulae]